MQGKCYALPDERPQMQRARELNQAINTGVGNEDIQLIEWVAEGMRSSAFDGLMLSARCIAGAGAGAGARVGNTEAGERTPARPA
jgi:hypothetical protein